MKKLMMAIVCLMTTVISVNAQNNWVVDFSEEDELLDRKSEKYYLYYDGDKGGVIFYESSPKKLYLIAPDGSMFNTKEMFKGVIAIDVTYGMYDENGKLVKKDENCVFEEVGREVANRVVSRTGGGFGHTYRNVGKELIEYLKNKKGYVRLVAPLFHNNRNFDIKVPCMNN